MNKIYRFLRNLKASKEAFKRLIEKEKKNENDKEWIKSLQSEIYDNVKVGGITIGKHSYIALNSIVYCSKIGNFCSIGPNCVIGYGNHPINFLSTSTKLFLNRLSNNNSRILESNLYESHSEIIIGNDVWIGAQVFIKNGIKIGDGSIIAAGAVVLNDVAPYTIVGGVPAKFIKYRFDEEVIRKLLEIKWWEFDDEILENYNYIFTKELNEEIILLLYSLKKELQIK